MAGDSAVIRLLEKKRYKLGMVTSGVYAYTEYLGKRIDTRRYRDGAIVVRCHHVTSCQSGDSVSVQAFHDGYTDEDPGLAFYSDVATGATASISFTNPAAGYPKVATTNVGGAGYYLSSMMAIKLTITKQVGANDLELDLSVDLVLRS